jgi:hypothetical protein
MQARRPRRDMLTGCVDVKYGFGDWCRRRLMLKLRVVSCLFVCSLCSGPARARVQFTCERTPGMRVLLEAAVKGLGQIFASTLS